MTYAAHGVTVRAGRATLLDGASLEIRGGEMVAVAGPNGAGKTTLVGALAGDIRPAEGGVTLDGRALPEWTAADLARRRAVMGADRPVAFAFTAEEVVMLGRAPIHGGSPTDEDRAVVAALLEAVDCAGLAARVSATLSTGERQRIQLARAIAQMHDAVETMDDSEPRYLLLDAVAMHGGVMIAGRTQDQAASVSASCLGCCCSATSTWIAGCDRGQPQH